MTDFLRRLRQRKLVQWAIAYVAFAFALIQVLDVVADSYSWPHLVMHFVFGILALGLVVMLVLAWYHGERGAQHVSGPELLLIALALAIGGGLLWHFGHAPATPGVAHAAATTHGAHPATATAVGTMAGRTTAASVPRSSASTSAAPPAEREPIPAKSVAVLPFLNESGNEDQQYFSDGLSEDLITALSQFAGLKVISRDSSFRFRHSKESPAEIGATLGVAHLLEGSVQRAGGEVRISATLVNAADGRTLWSHHYDRPYKDLFALQDDITKAVAKALKTQLRITPGALVQSDRPPSGSLTAYNDYVQARFYAQQFSEKGLRTAIVFLKKATHSDPRYALAWAGLANTWAALAGNMYSGEQAKQAWAKARKAVGTALSLDPDLAAAHAVNAFILSSADHDWAGALVAAKRAYQLQPARYFGALAGVQATLGHAQRAVDLIQRGLPSDPLCANCYGGLAMYLPVLGRLDQAAHAARKSLELKPGNYFIRMHLVEIEVMHGDAAAALKAARQQPSGLWRNVSLAFALQIGADRTSADAALQTMIDTQAGTGAYQIAEIYALRKQPDQVFKWLDRASRNRDPGINELLYDALILRYKNDPRFAAFCKQVGLPTTTDAVAMK